MDLRTLCFDKAVGISNWKLTFAGFLMGTWLLVSYYGASMDQLTSSSGRYSRRPSSNAIPSSSVFRQPRPMPFDGVKVTTTRPLQQQQQEYNFTTAKKILYFTSYFDMKDFAFGFGHEPFVKHGCPVSNCFATDDRKLLPRMADYDAVLFHMRNMDHRSVETPNQARRGASQRYVMFLMESPMHDGFPYHKLKNFFNWTMTYRQDSDIPHLYGYIEPKSNPYTYPPYASEMEKWMPYEEQSPGHNMTAKIEALNAITKKKLVAWIVSNCDTESQREHYIRELRNHIPVDIMGKCGNIVCDSTDNCTKSVDRDYKFYLSFENSFCNGYATEKFFTRINQNVVPIVFGKADYSAIAPPHSYINALDYESPKQLADYLLKLDSDHEAYLSYFWWKEHYSVRRDRGGAGAFCRLCAKLNDPEEPVKVYEDLTNWWVNGGNCEQKGSYPWSKPADNILIASMKEYAAKILGKPRV